MAWFDLAEVGGLEGSEGLWRMGEEVRTEGWRDVGGGGQEKVIHTCGHCSGSESGAKLLTALRPAALQSASWWTVGDCCCLQQPGGERENVVDPDKLEVYGGLVSQMDRMLFIFLFGLCFRSASAGRPSVRTRRRWSIRFCELTSKCWDAHESGPSRNKANAD